MYGISVSNLCALTPEGGYAVRLTNKTGAPSVKGTVVAASTTTANSFELTSADDFDPIGIVYEDGIADGALCWVVIGGRAQVKLENSVGSTVGYWVRTSTTAGGRADATNAAPPGLVLQHFAEIGHCLETVAGTAGGALCYIILHFN